MKKFLHPTPLIGKGVKMTIGSKPAHSILSDINNRVKEMEDSKKRLDELKILFDRATKTIDSGDFSKKDIDSITSVMEEIKNMEKSQLKTSSDILAKKIKQYSENKK
jgi:hypothetical protein